MPLVSWCLRLSARLNEKAKTSDYLKSNFDSESYFYLCFEFNFLLQFENLGYSQPLINLPVSLVYSAGTSSLFHFHYSWVKLWWAAANCVCVCFFLFQAILVEYLHVVLRPVITVPLLFTRSEVIMHLSSSIKGKSDSESYFWLSKHKMSLYTAERYSTGKLGTYISTLEIKLPAVWWEHSCLSLSNDRDWLH